LLAGDSALPTVGMGSTTGTGTVTQRETGECGVRAAARSSSGGGRGKEVLCTTGCRLAGSDRAEQTAVRVCKQNSRAPDAKWVGRRIKIMAGASVGGGEWSTRRSRAECRERVEDRGPIAPY
jgi:hypothetical protein